MNKIKPLLLALCAIELTGCGDSKIPRVVDKYQIYTDTIRNHVYLHVYGGGILHDPDCPCHQKGGKQ